MLEWVPVFPRGVEVRVRRHALLGGGCWVLAAWLVLRVLRRWVQLVFVCFWSCSGVWVMTIFYFTVFPPSSCLLFLPSPPALPVPASSSGWRAGERHGG
jgi:hypothetical protein